MQSEFELPLAPIRLRHRRSAEFQGVVLREVAAGQERVLCDTPQRTVDWIEANARQSPRWTPGVENFGVLLLNTRRRATGFQIVATGTLDTIVTHPREVFRLAIVRNASAIVLWHNHPSGDPSPSEGDIRVTRDLIRGGQLIKIELLDHLILADMPAVCPAKPWASLRELGYFHS